MKVISPFQFMLDLIIMIDKLYDYFKINVSLIRIIHAPVKII